MVRIPWRGLAEAAGLVVALSFVFTVQFIPHLDTFQDPPPDGDPPLVGLARAAYGYGTGVREGYPYAVHVDEHVHWVWSAQVQRWDTATPGRPYDAAPPTSNVFTSLRGAVHEAGYHLLIAQAQDLTGVPWEHVYTFLPAAWMTFIAFAVYALARPSPAAVPAALFVGLVPTTVRFLGPAFLVPIGFVLAWLPVTAILAEPARRRAGAAALLFLVVGWAFFVHLIGGFAAVVILVAGIFVGAAEDRRAAFTLAVIALLPVAWLYRAFTGDVQAELEREESLPIDWTIFDSFGVPSLFLWAAGLALLALHPPRQHAGPIKAVAGLSVVALALIVGGNVLDLGKYATYARWHPPFFLAAAVPMGHAVYVGGAYVVALARQGAQQAARWWRPVRHAARAGPVAAVVACVALAAFVVNEPLGFHLEEPYYHVMEDQTWAAFNHASSVAGAEYEVYLTHPWRAPFLAAMTGKHPHAVLLPGAPPNNGEDYSAYLSTGGDAELYILNDITLVIGPTPPPASLFQPAGSGVWLMDPAVAGEIARIRAAERSA